MEIKDILLGKSIDEEIVVKGWVKTHQTHGNVSFINVNDGSTIQNLQMVYKGVLETITTGSAINVTGKIKASKNKNQKYELEIKKINEITKSENFPIQKKEHSLEFLRENAHLRHRTTLFQAINSIKSNAFQEIHNFFNNLGFKWIQAPILTGNDCEEGSDSFEIKNSEQFFKKNVILSVSGQLHAEACALGLTKVYSFGPTFRAEKSNSSSHLAEFWMIEPEVAFCDLNQLMELIEKFIKHVFKNILLKNKEELIFLSKKIEDNENLIEKIEACLQDFFEKIKYSEAIKILKRDGFKVNFGDDLSSCMEKHITQITKKPTFVFNYPKKIKAFYMRENNEDSEIVNSVDLLIPEIGELIGGSERESKFDVIEKKIKLMKNSKELEWYSDIRKYGYESSAGFGCGFERLVMYLTGVKNIRDIVGFPRSYGQIKN